MCWRMHCMKLTVARHSMVVSHMVLARFRSGDTVLVTISGYPESWIQGLCSETPAFAWHMRWLDSYQWFVTAKDTRTSRPRTDWLLLPLDIRLANSFPQEINGLIHPSNISSAHIPDPSVPEVRCKRSISCWTTNHKEGLPGSATPGPLFLHILS